MNTITKPHNLLRAILYIYSIAYVISPVFAAQDTVRLMHYNTLNYGGSGNPSSYKNPRLTTIVNYVKPDILELNELNASPSYAQDILSNVLGAGWEKGAYSNTNNEIQTNMVFWRSGKLTLQKQTVISHILRDIIAFRLYYKDSNLATTHDTVFITVITCHLKAGSTAQDSINRAAETATVATWLNTAPAGNYVMMGDMNLYTSAEKAYQNIVGNTNLAARLYDPIAKPGNWHSNPSFAGIHTQSTRTSTLTDGGSNGGLDDRFDHIIMSEGIMNNTYRVGYIPQTYKAIGQDGNHLNKALTASPANTSVPTAVLQALYEMSDHLPVAADLIFTPGTVVPPPPASSVTNYAAAADDIKIVNPPTGEPGFIPGNTYANQQIKICIYSQDGKLIFKTTLLTGQAGKLYSIPTDNLPGNGLYLLTITNAKGYTKTGKINHL